MGPETSSVRAEIQALFYFSFSLSFGTNLSLITSQLEAERRGATGAFEMACFLSSGCFPDKLFVLENNLE